MKPLNEYKREHMVAVVRALKERGMTQRQVAAALKETEASLSSRLSGKRPSPDKYFEDFCRTFDAPFTPGQAPALSSSTTADPAEVYVTIPKALLDDLLGQTKTNTRLLNLALDRIEALTKELQKAPTP